jgi:hypothetical protein
MNPDPIERATDPIQSWQREPPEGDGWYVAALDFPVRPNPNGSAFHFVRLGPSSSGRRVAASLSDGLVDEIEDVSWWLVPGIDLPPLPEEQP